MEKAQRRLRSNPKQTTRVVKAEVAASLGNSDFGACVRKLVHRLVGVIEISNHEGLYASNS